MRAKSATSVTVTALLWTSSTAITAGRAYAQQAAAPVAIAPITIEAPPPQAGYAANPQFHTNSANLGPLGNQLILDTPASITVVPEDVLVNQHAATVNQALDYLPSVILNNQEGYEVSRPQSRGFEGGIAQNTRLDGLNTIGTTAIPTENLSSVQVLNGLSGSLYGPDTPAGVFNYILKRPTDTPLLRFIEGFDSNGMFTEQADVGGRTGPDNKIGYRLNVVHGQGGSYVPDSYADRSLFSADLDWHLDDQTVVETDYSHYHTNITGLPGSFVYDSGKSTILPKAVDPTKLGYGQPGAGSDLITDTGPVKLKHAFNDNWSFEIGGLYQNADRYLLGITNTLLDNSGNYTVTKNFDAVERFTIGSNIAYLNGHFDVFGMNNDFTFGTNGFVNGQYSYRNSITTVLGTASIANPVVFPRRAIPNNGGEYESGFLMEQSIILGDTIHFNEHWALQGVLSDSFLNAKSYSTTGQITSADSRSGELSPTVSLIYKPIAKLTAYATYANSVEEGDEAPPGTANVHQFLAPYRDHEYEAGVKYAVSNALLLTLDGFYMTRPLAQTNPTTNIFQVVGTQKNTGIELFAQGAVTPDLSIFGGMSYIDAKLTGTGSAATNDKRVVGVPLVKSDIVLDYHPGVAKGFAVTAAAHYEAARAATNSNNSYAPSYATLDLGLRYSTPFLGHFLTARFQVFNITNAFYYTSVANGNIIGSAGANTAWLAPPRTFAASLEFDF